MCPDQLFHNSDTLNDPIVLALIKLYASNGFFLDLYDGRWQAIVKWLTNGQLGNNGYKTPRTEAIKLIPWYAGNCNLYRMAELLRCCPGQLYLKLKDMENGN